MTKDIINKYRKVVWYIGIYEGIELLEIWKVHPSKLEEVFKGWDEWIDKHNGQPRNNPKIPLRVVRTGERVYRNPNKLMFTEKTELKEKPGNYIQNSLLDIE